MPAREAVQVVHDALHDQMQATLDALPLAAGESAPEPAAFLHPYASDTLEPASYPAVVVAHAAPEPPNQLRNPAPEPGTREWSDVRVPVEVRWLDAAGGDTAAARARAGAALRAAYQVVRMAAGRSLARVRLVGISETALEVGHDGTRPTGRMGFIAHVHEEML
jgi:hypothetical protein